MSWIVLPDTDVTKRTESLDRSSGGLTDLLPARRSKYTKCIRTDQQPRRQLCRLPNLVRLNQLCSWARVLNTPANLISFPARG